MKIISLIVASVFLFSLSTGVLAQEIELPNPGLTPESPFYFLEWFIYGKAGNIFNVQRKMAGWNYFQNASFKTWFNREIQLKLSKKRQRNVAFFSFSAELQESVLGTRPIPMEEGPLGFSINRDQDSCNSKEK